VTQVRTQFTPPAYAYCCPRGIFVRLNTAELNLRRSNRFLLGHPFANQLGGVALNVETHFRFHFTFKPASVGHPPQP
jgi:hypothetical protein